MIRNWLRNTPSPALPSGQRAYAVGDVHGRLDLLDQLLEQLERDNAARSQAQVTLIMLGDLVDRGPMSREVVARIRDGFEWARTVALMGNHEAVMLAVLDGQRDALQDWLRFGGRETLASWNVPVEIMDSGTLDEILAAVREAVTSDEHGWLNRLRPSFHLGDYYFVHAGVRPGVPLDRQVDDDRFWIRDEFLESRKNHGAMIVHGHSIKAEVEHRQNRIGLDTGAYATGKLTALGLENKERWVLST